MQRLIRLFSPRDGFSMIVGLLLLIGILLISMAVPRLSDAGSPQQAAIAVLSSTVSANNPADVMGWQACVKCHKLEVQAWMKTKHYKSLQILDPANANVQKYCKALGITPADVQKGGLCITCHATAQTNPAGITRAISGVSCESCHGASGGKDGWLNRHAVYGPNGTKPAMETPKHRATRIELCEKSGMIRAPRIARLAQNCFGCHLIGNEKLIAAGHKAGSTGFELVGWTSGEVRHNFHAEVQTPQTSNAEAPRLWMRNTGGTAAQRKRIKFVVGALTDLEASLRQRAAAKSPAIIAQLGGRIGGLNGKLAQIAGAAPTANQIPPLQGKIGAAFARLFAPMPGDQKYYTGIADAVAAAAKQFLKAHTGSKLAGLDGLLKATPPKGTVFQP